MPEEKEGPKLSYSAYGANSHIGDQGEYYCRSLYGLMKHPNGDRRPDLISVNDSYNPRLSMEVKTSMRGSGVINPYGLTYGFNSNFDYETILGAHLPKEDPESLFKDLEFDSFKGLSGVAFYYNIMQRVDGLQNEDFKNHFDDLRMVFGDQMLLPHELIFYSFVIGKMRGEGGSFPKAFDAVRKIVTDFLTKGYSYEHPCKNDCQAVHFNDYLSLFMNDTSLLRSDESKRRINLFMENYGEERFAKLQRIQYIGPNNTHIFAFYKPEHANLFTGQIKERIGKRRDIVTRLTQQRLKQAARLRQGYAPEEDMFPQKNVLLLTDKEIGMLERLLEWKRSDDAGPEFSDIHPEAVEPTHTGKTDDLPF